MSNTELKVTGFWGNPTRVVLNNGTAATITDKLVKELYKFSAPVDTRVERLEWLLNKFFQQAWANSDADTRALLEQNGIKTGEQLGEFLWGGEVGLLSGAPEAKA